MGSGASQETATMNSSCSRERTGRTVSSGWTWGGERWRGSIFRIQMSLRGLELGAGCADRRLPPLRLNWCADLWQNRACFLAYVFGGCGKGDRARDEKGSNMYRASTVNQVPYPLCGRNSMMAGYDQRRKFRLGETKKSVSGHTVSKWRS